jgi:hypothetical protein
VNGDHRLFFFSPLPLGCSAEGFAFCCCDAGLESLLVVEPEAGFFAEDAEPELEVEPDDDEGLDALLLLLAEAPAACGLFLSVLAFAEDDGALKDEAGFPVGSAAFFDSLPDFVFAEAEEAALALPLSALDFVESDFALPAD